MNIQHYSPQSIETMASTWTPEAFAMAADERLRQYDRHYRLSFVEIGIWCYYAELRESWKLMYDGRFHSFGHWITDAAPSSRTTCYAALGEIKMAIEGGMTTEQLADIPRWGLFTVNRLSTALKQEPEILAAVKTSTEDEFLRKIEREHPEQHMEAKAPMRFKPDRSQRQAIDSAIMSAIKLYDLPNREAALEVISLDWLEAHPTTQEEPC